jgi:hypothetical protein
MNEDFLGAHAPISLCSRISRLKAEAEGKLFFAMRLTLTAKSANNVEIRRPVPKRGLDFGRVTAPLDSLRKNSLLHLILGGAAVYRCDKRLVSKVGFKPLRSGCGAGNTFSAASRAMPFLPRRLRAIGRRKRLGGILF